MKRQGLLVGSFVLGALVLTMVAILWLSGTRLFETQIQAVIYFRDDVAGLYAGAPVTFRGVPVGRVESIGLEFDVKSLSARIPVNVRLSSGVVTYRNGEDSRSPPSLSAMVQRGLRAKLVEQSLVTGEKSIELNILPDASPVKVADEGRAEIPALPNRLDALVGQLEDVPIREVVAELRSTLKTTQAALDSVRDAMKAAHTTIDMTGRQLADLSAEARSTLSVARGAIVQVRNSSDTALASITRLADTATSTTSAARPDLLRTIASAREAADSANLAMGHIAEISAPDAPLRNDLGGAVADLAQAARALRDWSELLEEQPNALIFGRKP